MNFSLKWKESIPKGTIKILSACSYPERMDFPLERFDGEYIDAQVGLVVKEGVCRAREHEVGNHPAVALGY